MIEPFVASFVVALLSEIADKTQIASGLLAAKYLVPLPVFLGFVATLTIVIGLNVFISSAIAEKIPRKKIKIATGLLFIAFGFFALFF